MISISKKQGDHICSYRQQWSLDNPIRGLIHPPDKLFGQHVQPGMTVADTGCGLGYFTLALARMVGDAGRVIAVDVQPEALARLEKRAESQDLHRTIETWKCEKDDIGRLPMLDFALSFYMAHETPNAASYFKQMARAIKPGGSMLLVEPYFHVRYKKFQKEVTFAEQAGFRLGPIPSIRFSHAVLLHKA